MTSGRRSVSVLVSVAALGLWATNLVAQGQGGGQSRRPPVNAPIPPDSPALDHLKGPITVTIGATTATEFEMALAQAAVNEHVIVALAADIDLATPAPRTGALAAELLGQIQGNGHRLTNYRSDSPLIEIIGTTGCITDLRMDDVEIRATAPRTALGSVAGQIGGCLTNVHVTGVVEGPGGWWVGGLAGAGEAPIQRSSFEGTVKAPGYEHVGGLLGSYAGWSQVAIADSFAAGTVIGGIYNTGGLVGESAYDLAIRNSYFRGDVSGNQFVGGLVGYLYTKITGCYAAGTVSGPISSRVGRLAGGGTSSVGSSIADSYAEGTYGQLFGSNNEFGQTNVGFGTLSEIYDWVIAGWSGTTWIKDPLKLSDPVLTSY